MEIGLNEGCFHGKETIMVRSPKTSMHYIVTFRLKAKVHTYNVISNLLCGILPNSLPCIIDIGNYNTGYRVYLRILYVHYTSRTWISSCDLIVHLNIGIVYGKVTDWQIYKHTNQTSGLIDLGYTDIMTLTKMNQTLVSDCELIEKQKITRVKLRQ